MKDDKKQFNNYCLQQWTEYVERTKGKHEEPMSYKDYLKRNKKLFKKIWKIWSMDTTADDVLEEGYNARPQD